MNIQLNYISQVSQTQGSGGWDGINAALARELSLSCQLHYVGPIRPNQDYSTKLVSKASRLIGLRGAFSAYSEKRLEAYAKEIRGRVLPGMDADFFHGATPWLCCSPPRKYFTYIDACFHTFLRFYQNPASWKPQDLDRIYDMEKRWLERAERVFVSSNWAAEEARRAYGLDGCNMEIVGVGGHMQIPPKDTYAGERRFLAVMTDFFRKGGPVCAKAFRNVKDNYPDATLVFVGQAPPRDVLAIPGVEYAGFLRKSVKEELRRLMDLFSSAFALVLPTKAETSPIIIAEAGYFGCPTIAPRRFGIPEMLIDSETGLLIQGEVNVASVTEAMLTLCRTGENYLRLRATTRRHFTEHFTWKKVVGRIVPFLELCATAQVA